MKKLPILILLVIVAIVIVIIAKKEKVTPPIYKTDTPTRSEIPEFTPPTEGHDKG